MQQPEEPAQSELTGCDAEIARIIETNQQRQASETDWKPDPIDDQCILHHFVQRDNWPPGETRPFAAAFGNPGMSVVVSGGNFQLLTESELWSAIWATRKDTTLDLVGAVSFLAGSVRELGYTVLHDPNPYFKKSLNVFIEQTSNHAEIICKKKSAIKRERLREICAISLSPQTFTALGEPN